MASDFSPDLEILFRICVAAHGAVRQASSSPHRADIVAMGADGTPTEEIDRVAEGQVLASLETERVDWDLLSEEVGHVGRGGDRTLVVDPIDGSHNALRGLPFYAISLALGRRDLGGVDLAVVHDLTYGTTYWAERGKGAFRDGQRLHTRDWSPRGELFFVNLGRHSTPRAVKLAGRARRIRSMGCASIEMVWVAQGSADGYLFENDTYERNLRITDIAAAYRILVEAGGGAATASLDPLEPMPFDLTKHTTVFAWADPALRDRAIPEGYL